MINYVFFSIFQAVTTDLCDDYRKDIEQLEDINNRIEKKKNELEKSNVLSQNEMIQWLFSMKNEISKTDNERVKELKLVVNKTVLLDARDCLIKQLRPVKSEVTSFVPELISNIQNELNEHYDFEES